MDKPLNTRRGLLIKYYEEKIKKSNNIDDLISVIYPPNLNIDYKRIFIKTMVSDGCSLEEILSQIIPKKWITNNYDFALFIIRKEIGKKLQSLL